MGLGNLRWKKFKLPFKGTLQGFVLLAMRFNLGMSSLPKQLKRIKGNEHALYSDDRTIRTISGSTGTQQSARQEAVHITEQYNEAWELF